MTDAVRNRFSPTDFSAAPRQKVKVKLLSLNDIPPEVMARAREILKQFRENGNKLAEMERLGRIPQTFESNAMNATNVATLSHDRAVGEMEYIKDIIQTGAAAKYTLYAANGDKTTSSFQEYLGWLQAHVKSMEDDGTYSPSTVSAPGS